MNAAKQAEQQASQDRVQQQLAAQQLPSTPKKMQVECANRRTDEIKAFARWKCPGPWKRY